MVGDTFRAFIGSGNDEDDTAVAGANYAEITLRADSTVEVHVDGEEDLCGTFVTLLVDGNALLRVWADTDAELPLLRRAFQQAFLLLTEHIQQVEQEWGSLEDKGSERMVTGKLTISPAPDRAKLATLKEWARGRRG